MWFGGASRLAGHLLLMNAGGVWQDELRVSLCRCPQGIPVLQECNSTANTVCSSSVSSKTDIFLNTMAFSSSSSSSSSFFLFFFLLLLLFLFFSFFIF
jgi:hypothetical protein